MDTTTARNNALLFRAKWSFLEGTKSDRGVADEVAQTHQANESDISVSKRMFTKQTLKGIRALRTKTQKFVKEVSLPFDDNGMRLLPVTKLTEFQTFILGMSEKLEAEKALFLKDYDAIKEDAKERLNGMFKEEEFPTKDIITDGFALEVNYDQITDPKVLPAQVALLEKPEREAIQNSISKGIESKLKEAHRENFVKLIEVISHLAERLKVPTKTIAHNAGHIVVEDETPKFRNASIDAIKDALAVAEDFNFGDDPAFSALVKRLKLWLPNDLLDAKKLRDSESHRIQVKCQLEESVDHILENLPC